MLTVTICIVLLIILGFFKSTLKPIPKFVYMYFSGIFLMIIYSFRSYSLGLNDVENIYLYRYIRLINVPFLDVFSQNDIIFGSVTWSCWSKISQLIDEDFRFFLFLNSLVLVFAVWMYIYKYSEHYCLSTMMFICVYFSYSIYLLRHFFAFSAIMFFLLVKKHNILKYLLMLLAIFIHSTSVVFFVFYFISRKINSKKIIVSIAALGMLIVLIFGNVLTEFLVKNLFTGYYINMENGVYSAGNFSLFLFSFFFMISIPLIFKNNLNDFDKLFIFSMPILTGMIIYEDIYRLSFYFSVPYTILLFDSIAYIPYRFRMISKMVYCILAIVFLGYMGVNNNIYPYYLCDI